MLGTFYFEPTEGYEALQPPVTTAPRQGISFYTLPASEPIDYKTLQHP